VPSSAIPTLRTRVPQRCRTYPTWKREARAGRGNRFATRSQETKPCENRTVALVRTAAGAANGEPGIPIISAQNPLSTSRRTSAAGASSWSLVRPGKTLSLSQLGDTALASPLSRPRYGPGLRLKSRLPYSEGARSLQRQGRQNPGVGYPPTTKPRTIHRGAGVQGRRVTHYVRLLTAPAAKGPCRKGNRDLASDSPCCNYTVAEWRMGRSNGAKDI
jgi:hypothetical protein